LVEGGDERDGKAGAQERSDLEGERSLVLVREWGVLYTSSVHKLWYEYMLSKLTLLSVFSKQMNELRLVIRPSIRTSTHQSAQSGVQCSGEAPKSDEQPSERAKTFC
jgi:hypothetical protein